MKANETARDDLAEPKLLTRLLLYAFVATLPLQTIHLPLLNTEAIVSVPKLTGYAFFIGAVLDRSAAFRRIPWATWPILMFWCWSVMADIAEVTIDQSLLMQRSLLWIQSIVMFVLVANLCRSLTARSGVCLSFICAAGVVACLQLSGVATSAFGIYADTVSEDQIRMSMFGNDGNFVGCDYGLAVIMAIAVIAGYIPASPGFRLAALGFIPPLAIAMASTGSRTAVVASIVGVMGGSLFGLRGKDRFLGLFGGGIAIAGVIVLALQSEITRQRFEAAWYARDSSARDDIYLTSIELIQQNPWKGYGMSNHAYQIGAWDPTLIKTPYRDAHNIVLAAVLQAGVIGASLYAVGLFSILANVWRLRATKEAFLFFGVVGFLLIGNLLLPFDLRKVHWLMLGMLTNGQSGLSLVGLKKRGNIPRQRVLASSVGLAKAN